MNIGQLIAGLFLSVLGFVLIFVALFSRFGGGGLISLIYGIPSLIVGLFILFNRKEDSIEKLKAMKIPLKGGRKNKK